MPGHSDGLTSLWNGGDAVIKLVIFFGSCQTERNNRKVRATADRTAQGRDQSPP
jgi:hypothetical protein